MSTPNTERQPPYSEKAEQAVIGAMLIAAEKTVPMIRGSMKLRADDFYFPPHRAVVEAIYGLADRNSAIDAMIAQQALKDAGDLEKIGGAAFIDGLMDAVLSAEHAETYGRIVKEKAMRRRFIDICRAGLDGGFYDESEPTLQLLTKTMLDLQNLGADQMTKREGNVEIMDRLLARWQLHHDRRQKGDAVELPGLEMPFARMNELFCGLQPGLHFIAGKSSAGKTSFAGQMVDYWTMGGIPVLVIQLDDTHDDVIARIASRWGGVSLPSLQHGFARQRNIEKLRDEIRPQIAGMPLFVEEECENIEAACALARFYKAKHNIGAVVVDYVQIFDTEDEAGQREERQRLGVICTQLKRLWKQLRIPVVALSQTQRFKSKDDDGRTADMSDLFGGSVLEQTATSVTILKAIDQDQVLPQPIDTDGHAKKIAVMAHVEKNKHGAKGKMFLWFLAPYFRFEETRMERKDGIDRQMTWEDEIAWNRNNGRPWA